MLRLERFENGVDELIDKTTHIPSVLESDGTTKLSGKELTMQIGKLFVQRCYVNLQSDFLDTPDVFWDFDDFEAMYMFIFKLQKSYSNLKNHSNFLKFDC